MPSATPNSPECTVDAKDFKWYESFYSKGGWLYNTEIESASLRHCILNPLSLSGPRRVLEIGCGVGLHAWLWHEAGFNVTAIDASPTGIAHAKKQYPGPGYVCADLASFMANEGSFDVIFSRGMAWYHFELSRRNRQGVRVLAQTKRLFKMLSNGGLFILQIATDFSGSDAPSGIINNQLGKYVSFFSKFGEIVLVSNWSGRPLRSQSEARARGGNIIIACQKPQPRAQG